MDIRHVVGLCCKRQFETHEVSAAGNSGGNLKKAGDEGRLCPDVGTIDVVDLSLPDHRHRLVAGQRPSGSSQAAEAEPRPNQPFDPPVVLLDDVVQILALPQTREAPQFTRSLHLRRRARIGRILVHRDRARVYGVRLRQRLAEEPLGRRGISPGREQDVDSLAKAGVLVMWMLKVTLSKPLIELDKMLSSGECPETGGMRTEAI